MKNYMINNLLAIEVKKGKNALNYIKFDNFTGENYFLLNLIPNKILALN